MRMRAKVVATTLVNQHHVDKTYMFVQHEFTGQYYIILNPCMSDSGWVEGDVDSDAGWFSEHELEWVK